MFMFLMWRKLRWGSVLAAVLFSFQGLVWHSVYGQQAESQGGDTVQSASDSTGQVEWGKVLNLGRTINSTLSEYRPRVSTDGKTLYLCRKVADPSARLKFYRLLGVNYGDFMRMSQAARERKITQRITSMEPSELLELLTLLGEVDGHEDIYVSQLDSIEWSPARSAGYPLSTAVSNEGPESISTDNNQMFVFKDGDIYLTHRFGDRWSSLTKVEEPINSSAWDADICFSADGRTLFFASRRPGFTTSWSETGKNIDIWVTVKNDSGWGEPVNLGPTINTTKTDRTPFLHADGRTLYFASDGNGGQGGMDLFKTTRLSDSSWTAWSEPINLTPLNSPSDDWDLSMPANSEWAYFASARDGGLGLYDIYKYRLSPQDSIVAPELFVTLIAGVVTDPAGEPLAAEIRWENLATGKELGVARSNPVSGEYTIALPAGKEYGYYATKENYWDTSDNIDLSDLENYRELQVDILLTPILPDEGEEKVSSERLAMETVRPDTAGARIILRNIFFEFDQYTLNTKSHSELDRLAKKLKKHPQARIQIEGHTDDVGTAEYNRELSQKRADSVRDYLIVQNVSAERLVAVGFGETQPIVGNDTDEDRAENRRVQFVELSAVTRK